MSDPATVEVDKTRFQRRYVLEKIAEIDAIVAGLDSFEEHGSAMSKAIVKLLTATELLQQSLEK